MCLIVCCPAGVALDSEQVADIMEFANDGMGVMFCGYNGLVVERRMVHTPAAATRWLDTLPIEYERFIHFRRTTRGDTHKGNLHPFTLCNNRFGLMHNGTLPESLVPFELPAGMSDTDYFVRRYLARLPANVLATPAMWDLIGAATEDDRMVLLDGKTGRTYYTMRRLWHAGFSGLLLSNNYAITDSHLWGVTKPRKSINPHWQSPTGKPPVVPNGAS